MSDIAFEIVVVFLLLVANGIFAMTEIAVVTSRRARLKTMADGGSVNAKLALALANSPGRFLSTVQVGITLVTVLSGAVGGSAIADHLGHTLNQYPWMAGYGQPVAFTIVMVLITYFSVMIGELVPKRLALNNPERIASAMAPPLDGLSRFASPVVSILIASSDFVMRLMGVKKNMDNGVSEEEVRVLIDEGLSAGIFKKAEKEMVEGVFDLDEQHVEDLMTPRARMIWLSLDDSDEENWRKIAGSGHSHFPVYQKTRDNIVGMVSVKSLWANLSLAGRVELRALVTPPLYVPTTMPASKLIETFKKSGKHIALVVDEFGGLQGLVSLNDVLMAIVGNLPEREQRHDPKAILRQDGTWLVDALLEIEEMKNALGIIEEMPGENDDEYTTLGGFILSRLGHIPHEAEKVAWGGFDFEVVDMDRQRIDKVLVTPKPPEPVEEKKDGKDEEEKDKD